MADALDSKSSCRKAVWVQVPPPVVCSSAHYKTWQNSGAIYTRIHTHVGALDSRSRRLEGEGGKHSNFEITLRSTESAVRPPLFRDARLQQPPSIASQDAPALNPGRPFKKNGAHRVCRLPSRSKGSSPGS